MCTKNLGSIMETHHLFLKSKEYQGIINSKFDRASMKIQDPIDHNRLPRSFLLLIIIQRQRTQKNISQRAKHSGINLNQ